MKIPRRIPLRPAYWLGQRLRVSVEDFHVDWDGRRIDLTGGQVIVLATLIRNRGRCVNADAVARVAAEHGHALAASRNSLGVQIHHLRRIFARVGAPPFIGTGHGRGYVIPAELPAIDGAEGLSHG